MFSSGEMPSLSSSQHCLEHCLTTHQAITVSDADTILEYISGPRLTVSLNCYHFILKLSKSLNKCCSYFTINILIFLENSNYSKAYSTPLRNRDEICRLVKKRARGFWVRESEIEVETSIFLSNCSHKF